MRKLIVFVVLVVVCVTAFVGCEEAFPTKTETIQSADIYSWHFETTDDYNWYKENVWYNDQMSMEEKNEIYFDMTGEVIYQ